MAERLQLGCPESYDVMIVDRAIATRIGRFPWSSIQWGRTQDDISKATITGAGLECCGVASYIRPWRHAIVVYRNQKLVWAGPVLTVRVGSEVSIGCGDLMAWLYKRKIHDNASFVSVDLATIFNAAITDAMSVDNVPGLFPTATITGIVGDREFVSAQAQKAIDVVQELARTGVDYTMVGTDMVAGNFTINTAPIAVLTDKAFLSTPGVLLDGMSQGNAWEVGAGGGGASGFSTIGSYSLVNAADGVLEESTTEDKILDQATADRNAKSRWDLTHDTPISIEAISLSERAPTSIEALIPGAVVQMRLQRTCIPVSDNYRLQSVDVAVNSGAEGLTEEVSITMQRLGTETL